MPVSYTTSEGDIFVPGERVAEVVEPIEIPRRKYVAPRYLPRQPRN